MVGGMTNEFPRHLKIVTIWLLILLAGFLAAQALLRQQQAALFSSEGGVVELRRSADGHYHWPAKLNGRRVDFLVDTGATASAVPAALARELDLPQLGTLQSQTAGGRVDGDIVMAELELQGGLRVERIRLAALPKLHAPLLGMDVLGKLRLQQQSGVLRIDLGSTAR